MVALCAALAGCATYAPPQLPCPSHVPTLGSVDARIRAVIDENVAAPDPRVRALALSLQARLAHRADVMPVPGAGASADGDLATGDAYFDKRLGSMDANEVHAAALYFAQRRDARGVRARSLLRAELAQGDDFVRSANAAAALARAGEADALAWLHRAATATASAGDGDTEERVLALALIAPLAGSGRALVQSAWDANAWVALNAAAGLQRKARATLGDELAGCR